jgi:hypothetical protein
MKRCPKCSTTFGDDKRFCQIDGTPLIDGVEPIQTEDPYKTVVVGKQDLPLSSLVDDSLKSSIGKPESKDDDLLQLPEEFDPMKTMVVSEPIKFEKPVITPPKSDLVVPSPEIPKFDEPIISPPVFKDLTSEPKTDPVIDTKATSTYSDKPKTEVPIPNPFSDPPKVESPFSSPPIATPKFDANPLPSESPKFDSPFSTPANTPISSPFEPTPVSPAFKEPESPFGSPATPFGSPFGQNDMSSSPIQNDSPWSPPPAPVQSWGEQGIGQNTPFQPPPIGVGNGGQNQTLAIVSLVCGILGLCCGILGIVALITGFIQRGNIAKDPSQYGGGGLALAGMILGGISVFFTVIYIILNLLGALAGGLGR